jgi:glycosyltransferase involved in cell wall biosynthesis
MRILHTESSLGWGGQEIRVLTEARGVARRGHEVAIAAPAESRIYSAAPDYGVARVELPIARKSLRGLSALRAHLAAQRYDVVNTHSSTDSWLAAVACRTVGAGPAIVRTRHISAPVPRNAATRWLYRQAAHIVTTGERLKRQVVDEAGVDAARVTSIATGIDLTRFHPGDRAAARAAVGLVPDAPVVGIVATLRSWKGHGYLLEAVAGMARKDVQVAVVGDGPQREALHARARELGIEARTHFAGNRDDVVPWLQAFDVFCLPSYANEGVPQALMQSMACALPVVTTYVGSITELVDDGRTGMIVPPKDSLALRNALEALLADEARRRTLGEAALREARERLGEDVMVDAMIRVFDAAAAR